MNTKNKNLRKLFEYRLEQFIKTVNLYSDFVKGGIKDTLKRIVKAYGVPEVNITMVDYKCGPERIGKFYQGDEHPCNYRLFAFSKDKDNKLIIRSVDFEDDSNVYDFCEEEMNAGELSAILDALLTVEEKLDEGTFYITDKGIVFDSDDIWDALDEDKEHYWLIKDGRYFICNNPDDQDDIEEVPWETIVKKAGKMLNEKT